MTDWQTIASAGPDDKSGGPILVFVPSDGEDFARFYLVAWRTDGWLVEDEKFFVEPSHFARLERPK